MTFALALDGRFESFGDYRQPTGATAESTPVQQSSTGQTPAVQQQAMPVKTDWDAAFGENSYLYRTSNGNSPFIIQTQGRTERKEIKDSEGGTSLQDRSVEGAGQWRYNGKTASFDFYPAKGEIGVSSFNPADYAHQPTKSVSASELGLSYDPAFMVSALATKNGKNLDSWSNYALTHNNYGDYGTDQFNRSVSDGFRGEWRKITAYDAKVSGFDKFLEAAVIGGITTIATMGFGTALAAGMTSAGMSAGTAAVASNAVGGAIAGGMTAAATGGDVKKGMLMGGAGGAVGGYASTLEGGANFVGPVNPNGGLLSSSNLANAVGQTTLSAATGGNPMQTLASSVAGSAATNTSGSPFVGKLASLTAGKVVGDITSDQPTSQPTNTATTASAPKNTSLSSSEPQPQPGASFSYSLPSFNYVDLMGKRG
jgi:hypothetical protein